MSRLSAILVIGSILCASPAGAQMIHTSTPFQNLNSSFFESTSVDWSLRGENWFANFGGGGPLLPPFGGADPNAGVSTGVAFSRGGVSGNLSFNFLQGSSRSNVTTTPSLTTTNGVPGSIQSNIIRPFVTGFTPVVGGYPVIPNPMQTASEIGQQHLSNLRQSQAVMRNKKLRQYLIRAERAESEGNKRMLRANYRGAIAIAPEPLRSVLQQRLKLAMQKKDE